MARAPKKYVDKDRTQVRQEWLDWRDREIHERVAALGPSESMLYCPDEYGRAIPDEGCWIRIIEEPHTELRSRFRVPVMSVWRATRHEMNAGGIAGLRPQLARITTPGGDLCLYPHEYDVWDDVTWLIGQEPDVTMHVLGGKPLIPEEQLFYLMSRGIPQHEAALLMLNNLDQQDLVWFEFAPAYVEAFGTVGQPLWRHIQVSRAAS